MSGCNHDCANCSSKCSNENKESFLIKTEENSHIKKIIGVVSGKGGVGKSLVTTLLANTFAQAGYKTAILDADITGPSIPTAFNIHENLLSDGTLIQPAISKNNIKIVSTNLILENETQPIIWRGAIIVSLVKQFYSETNWGDIDYMFVDMPPGTGDVPLTVFQSLPLDGIVIVSTPQSLVSTIVEKAINMANMMNIKTIGMVENMSYVVCDKCDNHIELFGKGNSEKIEKLYGIKTLAKLPLDSKITEAIDAGKAHELNVLSYFEALKKEIEKL